MCAIAGIVRPTGLAASDASVVQRMLASQNHRGPDSTGYKTFPHCALGQNRLSLIDLRQINLPLQNPSGQLTLAYNGEIYNYKELRQELSSFYEFQTETDSEVVLAAYEKWGSDCVKKFNGMFAFFIWDDKNQTGFAARDPLGVKPFFFGANEFVFAFASEASVLAQNDLFGFQANKDYICEFLIAPYFSGSHSTPFKNIEILLPGHTLSIKNGQLAMSRYFSYDFKATSSTNTADWKEMLSSAVKRSLHADTEVGLFLSGGLDSTLLASLAARKLKTWTIRFDGNTDADYQQALIVKSDDYKYAVKAAQELGHEFNDVNVLEPDYPELLMKTLAQNDLISAWEQEVSQFALSQAASQQVKAVLVGDAADETHFGYPFLLSDRIVQSPENVIRFFDHVPLRRSQSVSDIVEKYRTYAIDHGYTWDGIANQKLAMSKLIVDFWLRRLLHNGDTHTMAHSLEGRVPFADSNLLVEAQKLMPMAGPEKSHLRNVAEGFVSSELAHRPKSALTKNLKAQAAIHARFVEHWEKYGDTLSDIVDADAITQWTRRSAQNLTDYEVGLEFRLLSALVWRRRFL